MMINNTMKCEVCQRINYQTDHHITSKCYGGTNHKSNLAYVCGSCHNDIHTGKVILEGRFQTTAGYILIWHLKGEPSITGFEPKVYIYGS